MLDLLIRGAAIGILAMISLVLMSTPRSRKTGRPALAVALLVSCYLVVSGPLSAQIPAPTRLILTIGATLVPFAFTWLMLELISGPQLRKWPWLCLGALSGLISFLSPVWPVVQEIRAGLVILLYGGLMWLAIRADRDDLVEVRRRFRRGFLALMTLLGVVISLIEAGGLDADIPAYIYPVQASAFLVLAGLFAWQTLRPGSEMFPASSPPSSPRPARQSDLIERLNAAMGMGVWQREGLSIRALALDLGVPEHRMRVAINQELGFRNFSTFINTRRIEAAKAVLGDPAGAEITILEIAYDCGFASLGPFNKAFRAQTGQSPREYRANPG